MKIINRLQKLYKKSLQDRRDRIYYKVSLNHSAKPDIYHALYGSDTWNLGEAQEDINSNRKKVMMFQEAQEKFNQTKEEFKGLENYGKDILIQNLYKQIIEDDQQQDQQKIKEKVKQAYQQMVDKNRYQKPLREYFQKDEKLDKQNID